MKLYIWCNPYRLKYGSSMVIAIAEDEHEARVIAKSGTKYDYGEYRDTHTPTTELGAPTRVVELPCAEWYEWSE